MFHVELRRFPHLTHAFNLTEEQLHVRVLRPWLSGAEFELNEKQWDPRRAKLTVYEGRELRPEEIGLGRGWANVTRTGTDVTQARLAQSRSPSAVEELKQELVGRIPIALSEVVELAAASHPQARPSEKLALAEQAVWELLHAGAAELQRDGQPATKNEWHLVLLDWSAWTSSPAALGPHRTGT